MFSEDLLEPIALVLQRLGSRHVMVVHSRDGLDEISIADKTEISGAQGGYGAPFQHQPEDFGIKRNPIDIIKATDSAESLRIIARFWTASRGRHAI